MKKYWALLIIFVVTLIWSGIQPYNHWHWLGEIAPNVIGLAFLIFYFKKFRFTFITYCAILLAAIFMFIGSKYTFSRVPFFTELYHSFGVQRNSFDKLGHFLQGVVPVLISREIFIKSKIVKINWVNFLSFCICMATTAVYEIIEYISCLIAGKELENFTGTQGYVWDSQTDMLAAMLGGLFVIFIFKSTHNRLIKKEFQVENEE